MIAERVDFIKRFDFIKKIEFVVLGKYCYVKFQGFFSPAEIMANKIILQIG